MPTAVLDVLGIAVVVICLRGPLRWAALTLLAGVFIVPDAVPFALGPSSFTVVRLLVWSSSAGLLVRAATGRVPWSSVRPGRVHLVLLGFVLMAYVVGVSWAPWPADFHAGVNQWLLMVDQLLFLWCVIAYTRVLGVRWMAIAAVALASVDAGIGVIERLTQASYAHWWYRHVTNLSPSIASVGGPLERRSLFGGSIRVRGNAEFALQYGWVLAMMTPLALTLAVERAPLSTKITKSWWVWLAPALLVVAMVLSVSRSLFVGLAAGGVVWLVCSRFDRRVLAVVALGGLIALAVVVAFPGLRHPYHGAQADSILSRIRREHFVGAAVVLRPYTGLGLAGLFPLGLVGTDSMLVLTYGTLGVAGLVGLAALFATPLGVAAAGGVRNRSLLAAGAAAGIVAGIVAAGAFDSLSGPTSAWALWLVAGIGVVAAGEGAPVQRVVAASEGAPVQRVVAAGEGAPVQRARRISPWRVLLPVTGLAIGLIASVAASPRATTISNFTAIDPRFLAPALGDPSYAGTLEVNTICQEGRAAVVGLPVTIVCEGAPSVTLGYLVISGPDPKTVATALRRFDIAARRISSPFARSVVSRFNERSTVYRTAPLWLGAGGLLLVLLVPPLYRRPRELRPAALQRRAAHA